MDWYPLFNSLRIAAVSTVIIFFLGILAAYYVAKLPRLGKGVLDVVLTLPLVLPPTVVGYFLLRLLGPKRVLGLWFLETFDLRLMLESYYISNVIMTLNTNEAMRLALRRNVEDNLEIVHRLTPDSPLDDYLVNYEYDIGFHHLLIKCSGNKLLMDLYQFLNPFLYINYVYNKQSKERLLTGIQEHQEIMEHLLNGNEEGARQSLTTHLANSKRVIISILKIDSIL